MSTASEFSDRHERFLGRRALIRAIESIWGRDSEMIYLVLWMWGSEEAAAMDPPHDIDRLVAGAVAGPGADEASYLRYRLGSLHDRVHSEALLAA